MTPAVLTTTSDDCMVRRRPLRGAPLDAAALALSGLEIMERYRDRRLPGPAVAHLTGLLITGAGPGTVTATMPLTHWLRWSRGQVPPPVLALLADTPLGAACQTLLPPGNLLATVQLTLAFPPLALDGDGALAAVGWAGKALPGNAMRSHVAITDGATAIAEGSALMVVRGAGAPGGGASGGAAPAPAAQDGEMPDPYLCPPEGETLGPDALSRLRGLDLVAGVARGDLPAPPLQRLCGLRPTSAREGVSVWQMPAVPWLSIVVPGEVYGGATAMLTGMAALGTADTLAPAGIAAQMRQLTVRLRGRAVPDGSELVAHGTVLRRAGEELRVRVQAMDRRGNVVATARATCTVRGV